MVLVRVSMPESLAARLFAYSTTCTKRVELEYIRLVTNDLSSMVDCSRLEKASWIPMELYAPYLPCQDVCWSYLRSSWASMKCSCNYGKVLASLFLHTLKYY